MNARLEKLIRGQLEGMKDYEYLEVIDFIREQTYDNEYEIIRMEDLDDNLSVTEYLSRDTYDFDIEDDYFMDDGETLSSFNLEYIKDNFSYNKVMMGLKEGISDEKLCDFFNLVHPILDAFYDNLSNVKEFLTKYSCKIASGGEIILIPLECEEEELEEEVNLEEEEE